MENFKRLEEVVLEEAVRASEPVKIFLVNGYQAKAVIQDFDDETILAKVNGHNWLIYRHAVSTIELGWKERGHERQEKPPLIRHG